MLALLRKRRVDLVLTGFVWLMTLAFVLGRHRNVGVLGAVGGLLLASVTAAPILFRRSRPILMIALVELATVIQMIAVDRATRISGFGLLVGMYAVAAYSDRSTSRRVAVTLAMVNTGLLLVGVVHEPDAGAGDILFNLVLIGGSWAAGDNIHTRRAYLASLEERAQRLEHDRTESARRAVLDERAHIARELHDVVAHHVSAIAVQAGAAEEIAITQPEKARQVLQSIQMTSRQALVEMRALVGVLKSDDGDGIELGPQPGLSQLEVLADQMAAAGVRVTISSDGAPRPLPAALDLSAYRIVQEALTNVIKHSGCAAADVSVTYGRDAVELLIDDAGRGPQAGNGAGGRGLVGMRERVALFAGALETGARSGGGFRVRARLPLPRNAE